MASNDLNKMDYKAEFLRGWPLDTGLELSRYQLGTSVNVEAGDLVKVSAGKLVKVAAADAAAFAGIVVRGNLDDKSVVASGNRPIVLWGNYIVRTQKFSGSPVAGAGVVADDGVFKPAGTDAPMGYVLEVITGTGGEPDSIIVVVA